ncbi:aminotransferase class V-fold PLP-dependent enzyme [Defluviimonas sp. WL0002]|uniref:Aminotransferase class V-fold PLP-dependent enzyme n=1 Tax=Albidovulum marisflavi TaxID=2984159 RepID=A0ABT2ZEE8_9RHOB|nr:aminotransferase class V-fold PLP-dependent enzyme [Defluviimonas sp. WL0002]MCV2869470.1 aminotransferase class V-fold PLP-dependent enzyme [Defluviimonas sp. WL0002]
MNLAMGRPYLAIPGPSVMPDRVLNAMHRAAPDIYAGALHDMTASLYPDLRAVARTDHHVAIYIGNGHAAWEAANCNLFSRGERALALTTGAFGTSWANSVERLGVRVDRIDFGRCDAADPARVAEALAADPGHQIKVVLLTHVDTASTVRNDVAAVRAAMDSAGHPALLAVDCIASLACDPFLMDEWGVDVMVGASQKGLMTPPGLGLVWFSDRALECCSGSDLRTPYWDWTPRAFAQEYWQRFCGTAPTHHLFGLREALTMLVHEEGLEAAWARHRTLARAVWAAVDVWGQGGDIALNIADPAARGHSVTSVRVGGAATRLRRWCAEQAGVTLGVGLGMEDAEDDWLRIAHMGHVNAHMTLGALSVIESGLCALDIPHGKGALEAAASVIASA